jgi:hypothetical protein
MPTLCISVPRPAPRLRAVIVIIIYLAAFRLAPGDSVPLALGGALGGMLAIEPAWTQQAAGVRERTR